eukprot:g27068.t1
MCDQATLQDAVESGIDLSSNAFMLIHGWTAGPLLLEFMCAGLKAQAGPLAILLRTCRILGYLSVNETGAYSTVEGVELDELRTLLRPSSGMARAIRSVYAEAIPPFKVLPILLDGIILAPLLTSITYFARWSEEGLDYGKDKAMEKFDFSKVDTASRIALGARRGGDEPQRYCFALYPWITGIAKVLLLLCSNAEFKNILFEEPGWGFVDMQENESEIHVERTLNVVGSGAQHSTLFKDLMRHMDFVFSGDEFSSQPRYVVDTGSGDGHLLMQVYQHIKEHTPRGQHLEETAEFPLIMIGVDFNEESRVATAVNLTKSNITHMVLFGDIGAPKQIMAALQKKGETVGDVVLEFARSAMRDCVHLDKQGQRLSELESFSSLVEHFKRWADALEGSFGLCLLEVMMLDVPTTERFINDCVSFHFDIVQCLSRQYMTSPVAFAMGAAMAGLLPANIKNVQTYPEQGKYCRDGRIIQLIAIASNPQTEVKKLGIGSELRSFALHLGRLDPTVDVVVGVTRCRDFKASKRSMQQYVDDHKAGRLVDPILDFHTGYGAEVVRVVPDFRPEDVDNEGVGVLIQYNVKSLGKVLETQVQKAKVEIPSIEVLSQIMDELGYKLDRLDLHKGFFDYGMDSLELIRVRNRLSSSFRLDLPATLLLDFPTVKDLADQLDRDRGIGDLVESLSAESDDSEAEQEVSGWEGVTPTELLELQEKFMAAYKEPFYQKQFSELARKCYPETWLTLCRSLAPFFAKDMMRYILAIEEILVQVEGPLLLEFGLIDSLDWQTVQIGRSHMTATQVKYWKDFPEVKQTMDEILHITKQDHFARPPLAEHHREVTMRTLLTEDRSHEDLVTAPLYSPAESVHGLSPCQESVKVPKGCKITVKSKIVEVTGKHGSLKRDFKHLPIELFLANGGKKVVARMYFAKSKQCSMLNTVCSHISNLFEGVTKKFEYKMRLVYAHFPINVNIVSGGKTIEIRNFLGEKMVRTVHMLPGATDEILVTSTDIDLAGRSAALIHQSCLCKKKDIRKFLDGIYVSSHGVKEDR